MIKYIHGDLFKTEHKIIAHGCNCKNGFGSGVAYTMSIEHPKAKLAYHRKYEEEGWELGEVQFVNSNGKIIANCATQFNFMPRGPRHVDYDAVRRCMEKVKIYAQASNSGVAIPKIGAGLAGGDWAVIEQIINEVFDNYDVTVYIKD